MRSVLGSRASIGGVLGSGRGAAAAADWWLSGGVSAANAIAVYQPIGAASLAASYTNLANPGTYTAVPGVAPTWAAATGWAFNGSTQWLNSGVVQSAAGWSAIVRFTKTGTSIGALCGAVAVSPTRRSLQILTDVVTANTNFYGNAGDAFLEVSPRSTGGTLAIAGKTAYRNGSADGTIGAGSGATLPGIAIHIGSSNTAGSPGALWNGKIQAFAIYDKILNAAQVAAISTAMAALTG